MVCAFAEIKFFCETPAIADIVILVDGSWSIGRFNFRLVRNFLENLVTAFNVGSEKTRIGIPYGPEKLVATTKCLGRFFRNSETLYKAAFKVIKGSTTPLFLKAHVHINKYFFPSNFILSLLNFPIHAAIHLTIEYTNSFFSLPFNIDINKALEYHLHKNSSTAICV